MLQQNGKDWILVDDLYMCIVAAHLIYRTIASSCQLVV